MIRLENVLNISLQDVLTMSWRRFCKTSWRHLENVLKTSWRRLEDVLKTFYEDVLQMRLADVLNVCWVTVVTVVTISSKKNKNGIRTLSKISFFIHEESDKRKWKKLIHFLEVGHLYWRNIDFHCQHYLFRDICYRLSSLIFLDTFFPVSA